MTGAHHPWRAFSKLTDWRLKWATLPDGNWGETCFRTRTVTIDPHLTQAERRCTIEHERHHVLRGPARVEDALREELIVDRRAARLLMPSFREVVDSMVFHGGHVERAADDLWVDPFLLEVRLSALLPSERVYLERRKADMLIEG